MDVKPWGPLTLRYIENENEGELNPIDWPWGPDDFRWLATKDGCKEWLPALVTLANGQLIIVRALSDERKAARAAMKEALS